MCGIAGIWNYRSHRPVSDSELRALSDCIKHRGPDDEGLWSNEEVGLAFRRLSIIDLAGGHQPLCNEDGTVWLVFNGEIYNFRDLRPLLQAKGHTFSTNTDSEVIIHAYEEYGVDCLHHLDGMFAFAIWDERHHRLFAARDRLGKKPLVYAETDEGVAFASEIRALVGHAGVSREIDLEGLADYLTLGYITSPVTVYRAVRKLPPGHYLILEAGERRIVRYWSLQYDTDNTLTEGEAIEAVRREVRAAVEARLVSDVPLGAFLSGGIDSSIVVGLMAGMIDEPVRTFSIGFFDHDHNELPFARLVANRFGTEHHEFVVEPNMVDTLPRIAAQYGEPFADSSALPTFFLSELTRQHVTVALSGDGGDELFGGYYRYGPALKSAQWDNLPQPVRRGGSWIASHLPDSTLRYRRFAQFRVMAGTSSLAQRYRYWITGGGGQEIAGLLRGPLADALESAQTYRRSIEPWLESPQATDPLNRMLLADTMTYLPDDILVKVDIASMAHSLEVRCPLLDHHVAELAARIPPGLKRHGTTGKYILRRAFDELLPPPAANRAKRGFSIPLARWLREDLYPMTHDLLLSGHGITDGYFDRSALERLLTDHRAARADCSGVLWSLLMFELWFRSQDSVGSNRTASLGAPAAS